MTGGQHNTGNIVTGQFGQKVRHLYLRIEKLKHLHRTKKFEFLWQPHKRHIWGCRHAKNRPAGKPKRAAFYQRFILTFGNQIKNNGTC